MSELEIIITNIIGVESFRVAIVRPSIGSYVVYGQDNNEETYSVTLKRTNIEAYALAKIRFMEGKYAN